VQCLRTVSTDLPAEAPWRRQSRGEVLQHELPDAGARRSQGGCSPSGAAEVQALRLLRRAVHTDAGQSRGVRSHLQSAASQGRSALDADWRILPPSPDGVATFSRSPHIAMIDA
jgi:hypothetical protein